MLFKFPRHLLFYINDRMTQTNENGDYKLDDDLFRFIVKEINKTKKGEIGKEEIYQYLLDHSLLEKESVVRAHGSSGRIAVPKRLVDKHVKYWIAVLPDIIPPEYQV